MPKGFRSRGHLVDEQGLKDYSAVIHRVLNDKNINQKAEEFAAQYADFDQQKQVSDIANRIEELITEDS